ncbi:hypothetical protein Nepgr_003590 [Nepenthes gracilis]|uniref:GCK domain-containing protein n=1 Tax=Nepenthes gracilis TaxID=150966 RepID=A0AAD3RZS5_NEPGR|nr:hypothetical protein Nepgr_003590 [Nepenthes gracilis]
MSSSSSEPLKLDPPSQNPDHKTLEIQHGEISIQSDNDDAKGQIDGEVEETEDGGEEEEEGECGFCLFMKGGGCRESFIAWEKCVEEAEKNKEDAVEKCFEITTNLRKCMDAHSDYYEPILRAEKEAMKELEPQLEKENDPRNAVSQYSNGSEISVKQVDSDSKEDYGGF